ncbi:MAG: tRNA (guanosine(46)-N7)-methyltransferase TrmB [Pseudomonadota bacterium]|nr:tRNA (guanosine(46)-N7)-methyltransferase TrmB [Pseudomonadota bacterium]
MGLQDLTPGLDRIYSRRGPIHLEIGTGNGENLLAMAQAAPGNNYLGCEVHRPGLGHTLLGLRLRRLHNVKLVESDAVDLLYALTPASLDRVYLFFPDPWPKKRHHKRRLVQGAFLDLLADRLNRSGQVHFASDNVGYAESILETIDRSPAWLNLAGAGHWAPRPRYRVITRFEHRALRDQRRVYEIAIAKVTG